MKKPWCKFYPRDWMGDAELRSLGYAARGLWTDMLCLMRMGEKPDFLIVAGKPISPHDLARLTGGKLREVNQLLAQLEAAGVFSRDADGVIYSRRVLRDDAQSEEKRAAGKRGGSPLLKQPLKQSNGAAARDLDKPIFQKSEETTTTTMKNNTNGHEAVGFSLAEVQAVFTEVSMPELAQEFFDYNEGRGWEKVCNLSAMARHYIRRHKERQSKRMISRGKRSRPAKSAGKYRTRTDASRYDYNEPTKIDWGGAPSKVCHSRARSE